MAVQLKKKAEEMFSHDEYKIDDIRLTAEEQVRSEEDVKTISVYMAPSSEKPCKPSHRSTSAQTANTNRKAQPTKKRPQTSKKNLRIWEIGSEKITVYMEGGEKNGHE